MLSFPIKKGWNTRCSIICLNSLTHYIYIIGDYLLKISLCYYFVHQYWYNIDIEVFGLRYFDMIAITLQSIGFGQMSTRQPLLVLLLRFCSSRHSNPPDACYHHVYDMLTPTKQRKIIYEWIGFKWLSCILWCHFCHYRTRSIITDIYSLHLLNVYPDWTKMCPHTETVSAEVPGPEEAFLTN